jgi:hypothetical protein
MGHIGYKKIENFKLISKKQTCLNDKMPLKKVKIKNCFLNLLSPIFLFFNFYFFWGHFVTKVSLYFLNQHKILDFLMPYMTYFKKKNVHLSEGLILNSSTQKAKKDRNNKK